MYDYLLLNNHRVLGGGPLPSVLHPKHPFFTVYISQAAADFHRRCRKLLETQELTCLFSSFPADLSTLTYFCNFLRNWSFVLKL